MPDEQIITPAGAENTEQQMGHMIPKARFDEVNLAMKAARAELDELKRQQSEADERRLAEQQKFQELYEKAKAELDTLRPFKQTAESAQAALAATVEAEIAQLPEDARDLVPSYEDPKRTLEWLTKNKPRLLRPPVPSTDAGVRGDPAKSVKLTPGQENALAHAQRSDPTLTRERYIAALLHTQGGD